MAGQDIEQVHSFPFGTDENQAKSWIANTFEVPFDSLDIKKCTSLADGGIRERYVVTRIYDYQTIYDEYEFSDDWDKHWRFGESRVSDQEGSMFDKFEDVCFWVCFGFMIFIMVVCSISLITSAG